MFLFFPSAGGSASWNQFTIDWLIDNDHDFCVGLHGPRPLCSQAVSGKIGAIRLLRSRSQGAN